LADGTEARTLVRRLNQLYDESGRAFRVEEVAGGFRLLSRRQFAPWLRRLEHVPAEMRLSAPSLETLAVVAYRQPVLRADIEAIRGVSCGEILRQLMEKDLVRIGGRSEELGRPYLYTTTKRFLQLFGLQNLDQLPRAGALRDDTSSEGTAPASGTETGFSVDQQQEEGSEVRVTLPNQVSEREPMEDVALVAAADPQLSVDDDEDYEEYEDDDYEDEDDEDEEDEIEVEDEDFDEDDEEYEDDEDEDDDLDDDDLEDDDLDDDDLEDDEWEEVEDDADEDDDWDEDEEDWDDEDYEEEDEEDDEDWE
jgi:segregation and condensation protein B